tara:strand:+ start:298 stop:693 length:396 start_codon:yes stop_codon:yes gene_type:complete
MKHILSLLALLLALPAFAQDLMSAEEFDAYTRGKTLYYGQNGRAYGAEIYYDNRRVKWSFLDGECKDGSWFEEAGLICFVYDDNPSPQCWSFVSGPTGLIARFENAADTTELYEARDIGKDLICLGPKVGV